MTSVLRRPARPEPAPTVDQVAQRRRRRARHLVVYGGEFDLAAEVRDLTAPLAERITAEPSPLAHRDQVHDLAAAVSAVTRTLAGLLAKRDAQRRAASLPAESRDLAVRALLDLVELPADPVIADAEIRSGRWATVLVDHVRPLSDPLADYLAVAHRPGEIAGHSLSERVENLLREIDLEVRDLEVRLDAAERARDRTARGETPETTRRREAAATLAELGLTDEKITR